MSRGLGWTLGGIFAGFGVLFFTVWRSEDSMSMVAIMFAVSSVMFATTEATQKRKAPCPDQAGDQASAD
ncbi:hypothetical protein [Brevundimonas subvibrioides]|uniref:Uncharacterized protein n=1 Tax=Brevundimonas subvibrioides (strain ATCC 15264 / DSM 4735 / LMG 14903 / NBRC 16000 / CB 81) TaxID=633149 RepID=D9QGT1_BRESC|nr:hypothetical protein [Brevundimonas subvibrioides]ADL00897.1 hypothetical protein Bresu_1586 [Brevundimonas subvibrioides ATCC 15264]